MSQRTDVDALAQLADDERAERIRAAFERIEMRANRCRVENRDLTAREASLCTDDRDEHEALQKAVTIAEHRERVMQAISEVTEQRSAPLQRTLLVSQRHLEEHAAALRDGRQFGRRGRDPRLEAQKHELP